MSEDFDPYYKWLAIPPSEQPPNFYRLLCLPLFEADQEVIAAAAVQRINWVRNFEIGPSGEVAKRLKDEISSAWMCLRDPAQKAQYDRQLKLRSTAQVVPPPLPPSLFGAAMQSSSSAQHPAATGAGDFFPNIEALRRPDNGKSSSSFLLQSVFGGAIGLVLGYIVLCQFGPQYDFLHLWATSEQAKSPAAVVVASSSRAPTGALRKGTPRSQSENPSNSQSASGRKLTQSPIIQSEVNNSKSEAAEAEATATLTVPEPPSVSPSSPADENSTPQTDVQPRSGRKVIPITSSGDLQQAIQKCRVAKEAVQILKDTIADISASNNVKTFAQAQLPVWEDRAANDNVRLGESWLPRSDAIGRREKANELVIQAAGLLTLDNDHSALDRLRQSRTLDPEATTAVYLLGVHCALGLKNYQEAKDYFAECLRRRPDDIGALIDLGIANLMLSRHSEALNNFRAAAAQNPRSAELDHNLRRIIRQEGLKLLVLPPLVKEGFVGLLKGVINDQIVTGLDNLGWLYVAPATATADGGLPAEAPDVLNRFMLAKTDKTVRIHSQWIEDCQCPWCRGAAKLPCTNPECKNGKITVVSGKERIGYDVQLRKTLYRDKTELKECPTCKGTGYLKCDKCLGTGIDPAVNINAAEVSKR